MLVCESCHKARQARQAMESQPLQFTGYETKATRPVGCPDCGNSHKGGQYEYSTAFELLGELEEAREKLEKYENRPPFPLDFWDSAADMAEHAQSFPAVLSDTEAFQQVLQYAAELEEITP